MSTLVNVGVVGCGYWGPNLARNLRSVPECRLRVVCDADPRRLNHMAALYPDVACEMDYARMLRSAPVDAVVIPTPVRFHFRMARAALEAGKHVMIEKPMASTSDECAELIGLAEARGLTLMVGHTFLYSTAVRKIQELVGAGEIGRIRYISSRRLNLGLFQKDINVAWDLAPHDLSIVLQVIGEPPTGVNCQGNAHVTPGIEDITGMSLFFADGRFATVQSSWLDPRKVREMTIVGSRKMIVYDDVEPLQKIKVYDARVERPPHYDTFAEFQYSYHYGDCHIPYLKQEEPLRVECQHFVDCIRTGKAPLSGGRQGMQLVRILEAASESLRRGGMRVHLAQDGGASVTPMDGGLGNQEPPATAAA